MYFYLFIQHLEAVIRAKIPSIIAMINKTIDEIEAQLDRLGRPVGGDAGVRINVFLMTSVTLWWELIIGILGGLWHKLHYLFAGMIPLCIMYFWILFMLYVSLYLHNLQAQLYTILDMCRAFDRVFKEHLDGG